MYQLRQRSGRAAATAITRGDSGHQPLAAALRRRPHDQPGTIPAGCKETGKPAAFEVFDPKRGLLAEIRAYPADDGLLVYCCDISDRRQAEAALLAVARRDRTLVEHTADGVLLTDESGTIVEVNARLCAILGYTREELLGRCFMGFVAPDDLAAHPLRIADLIAGQTILVERRWLRRDGSMVYIESNSRLFDDRQAQIIIRDISERKQTEADLRASEALLAEAQRIAQLGSWSWMRRRIASHGQPNSTASSASPLPNSRATLPDTCAASIPRTAKVPRDNRRRVA